MPKNVYAHKKTQHSYSFICLAYCVLRFTLANTKVYKIPFILEFFCYFVCLVTPATADCEESTSGCQEKGEKFNCCQFVFSSNEAKNLVLL